MSLANIRSTEEDQPMGSILRLLIVFLALSCITANGWAKEGKPKLKVKPFILIETTEKLPPGFNGDDIIELASTLLRAKEKDEYETTLEYQKRKDKILSGVMAKLYAFAIPNYKKRYDADQQLLEIKHENFGVPENDGKITITDIEEIAYSKNWIFEYKVAYKEPHIDGLSRKETIYTYTPQLMDKRVSHEFVGHVTLPIKEAKTLSEKIAILAICKLDNDSPDFPIKTDQTLTTIIPVKLLGIWVYNTQTGEIYLKKKATEVTSSANPKPEEQKVGKQ